MSRISEHTAFAANLLRAALADFAAENYACAYAQILDARSELDTAARLMQIEHTAAVLDSQSAERSHHEQIIRHTAESLLTGEAPRGPLF